MNDDYKCPEPKESYGVKIRITETTKGYPTDYDEPCTYNELHNKNNFKDFIEWLENYNKTSYHDDPKIEILEKAKEFYDKG